VSGSSSLSGRAIALKSGGRSRDKASNCAYGWAVAGDLLLLVLNAAVLAPEHATLARAVRVWTEDQAKGRTLEGRKVAASPRSVREAWSRFKPVAHLCAAWRIYNDGAPSAEQLDPTSERTLPNFLAAAEIFRSWGEAHHAPSGRKGTKFYRESLLSYPRRRPGTMEDSGSFEVVSCESGIAVGARQGGGSAVVELYGTFQ
jgi:hypothetical protein